LFLSPPDARAEGEKKKNLLGGTFTVLNKSLVSWHEAACNENRFRLCGENAEE
jgi:hypothetical protein